MKNIGRQLLQHFGSQMTKLIDKDRNFIVTDTRTLVTSSNFNSVGELYLSTLMAES